MFPVSTRSRFAGLSVLILTAASRGATSVRERDTHVLVHRRAGVVPRLWLLTRLCEQELRPRRLRRLLWHAELAGRVPHWILLPR